MKLLWHFCLTFLLGLTACYDTVPTPPTGKPVIETGNAKTASIGTRGGQVSASASNGVTYSLVIPPNALNQTTNITLTPISSMGNAPLSAGVSAAVQMEPSGLSFKRSATLRIGNTSSVAAGKRLFGFGSANDGTKFRLNSPAVKSGLTELKINHFSDAGLGNATDAEIAQIPAIEPLATQTSDDFSDAVNYAASVRLPDQEIADELEQWFAQIVKPALLEAENSSDLSKVIDAQLAFEKWFDARVNVAASSEGKIDVEPFLTDEDAFARPIVAKLLVFELNQRIESCKTDPAIANKFSDLNLVNLVQNLALKFKMDTAALMLDAASIAQKMNDCARVVIDPIKPFTQIVVGSDKSLDARAQMVFVGIPDPQAANFEFKVSASGATVKQASGFSSSDGRYTTVFTPNNKDFVLSVQACLVLPGDTEASSLCAAQDVHPVLADGIFRGTLSLNAQFEFSNTINTSTLQSSVSEKTNLSFDANVELTPSNPNANKITSKNATLNFIETRDSIEKIDLGNCIISQHNTKNATDIGTGSSVDPADKLSLSLNASTYTIEVLKIFGPATYKGTDTTAVSVVSGNCNPDAGSSTPFQFFNASTQYLPNREIPTGTGTILTNIDGSRTIAGSATVTGIGASGPGFTRNYTLTWNLTAF